MEDVCYVFGVMEYGVSVVDWFFLKLLIVYYDIVFLVWLGIFFVILDVVEFDCIFVVIVLIEMVGMVFMVIVFGE